MEIIIFLFIPGTPTLPPLTTLPGEPVGFVATGKTATTITLAWQRPFSNYQDISQYLIDYNVQGGSKSELAFPSVFTIINDSWLLIEEKVLVGTKFESLSENFFHLAVYFYQ